MEQTKRFAPMHFKVALNGREGLAALAKKDKGAVVTITVDGLNYASFSLADPVSIEVARSLCGLGSVILWHESGDEMVDVCNYPGALDESNGATEFYVAL